MAVAVGRQHQALRRIAGERQPTPHAHAEAGLRLTG